MNCKVTSEAHKEGFYAFYKDNLKGISGNKNSTILKAFENSLKSGDKAKVSSGAFSKSSNASRLRFCRVFYGPEKSLRTYHKDASMAFSILRYADKTIGELTLIEAIRTKESSTKQPREMLIISKELTALLDCDACKVLWRIPSQSILKVTSDESQVDVLLASPLKTKTGPMDKFSFQTLGSKISNLIAQKIDVVKGSK
mgnify:FL=1